MYPDILNLHGDRGNIMALCKIAESLSLGMDIVKVNNYKELPDLKEIDFMFAAMAKVNGVLGKALLERVRKEKQ